MSHLLLLASPPTTHPSVLSQLYTSALLTSLTNTSPTTPSTLDIAIHTPYLSHPSRRKHFHRAQQLLGRLYTLSNTLAETTARVELVDIRIVFVTTPENDAAAAAEKEWPFGPVVSLQRLAAARRWDHATITAFPVSNAKENVSPTKATETFAWFASLLSDVSGTIIHRLSLPSISSLPENFQEPPLDPEFTEHSLVAVGGTFDHLHPGHKHLLTMSLFLLAPPSPHLIIGLTGPLLLKSKKHASHLSTWSSRAMSIFGFISAILLSPAPLEFAPEAATTPITEITPQNFTFRYVSKGGGEVTVEVVEINDPFGPTITNKAITALVVSEETRGGGESVNVVRREKGWRALECWVVDVVEGGKGKLSSTEIRRGLEEKGEKL
ncbi:hypothetical protein RUND412_000247 [Rhizina undulata]